MTPSPGIRGLIFRQASLPLSLAILVVVGVLLLFLGILLFPVNLGIIPFSPDGQMGVLLVITAIQMMALGETPLGQFRRSWFLVLIGLVFASMGIVLSMIPGVFADLIRMLLGALNISGGLLFLGKMYFSAIGGKADLTSPPEHLQPILKKMRRTQTILNIVSIAFGISMLFPGLISGFIVAVILMINGGLIFKLVTIVNRFE